ncbi:MAG: NUDIX domain-containing protein [Candidatus Krumholzibacteriia bacterium]
MRFILVVERKHLFPGLSPQGFLPAAAVDLDGLAAHLFFAERGYMERNSHYKQIIPYLMLERGADDDARLLVYQRRAAHSERRLGGLWSAGFGGHVEPLDRTDELVRVAGLVRAAALRELEEETGLVRSADQVERIGFLNSDREEVSSVHFGVVYRVRLDDLPDDDEVLCRRVCDQVEPHRALWLPRRQLEAMTASGDAPDGGTFEDWTRLVLQGLA